jgi:hypothetical protein
MISTLVSRVAEEALKEHKEVVECIGTFKTNLRDLISYISKNDPSTKLPFFIFVDELDRCRPNYAIELLENIKHLFGVNGVYFVVATDSAQLCHSIKVVYGGDFDAEKYLKRFFDQEYNFISPGHDQFADYLLEKLSLKRSDTLLSPLSHDLCDSRDPIVEVFSKFSSYFKLDLRGQEQVAKTLKTILILSGDRKLHMPLILYLLMLKNLGGDWFDKFHAGYKKGHTPKAIKDLDKTGKVNSEIMVRTRINQKGGAAKTVSITIMEVVEGYCKFADQTYSDVRDREDGPNHLLRSIKSQVAESTLTNDGKASSVLNDLLNYPDYIRQAGRLFDVMDEKRRNSTPRGRTHVGS